MKKYLIRLSLLPFLALLFITACSSEQVTGPNKPEQQSAPMELHFGVTNDQDYVPFAASTIPVVTGGSGVYSYELYQDGQFLGHNPIQVLRFTEVRDYEITLKVRDAETDSVRTASVTVSALPAPPNLPLEATLYTADFSGIVPFEASVLGIARGGVPPYSYEILVDGVSLYEDDNAPIYINEEGYHEVIFKVTDSEGTMVQDNTVVYGHLPEEEPLMRINFIAVPQTVEMGKSTGLITQVYGGQAPFEFEIRVDGQLVAFEPTYLYQVNFLGEKIAMVKVTDATGTSSEIGLSIFGIEPNIYIPPVTVDVTASPHEAQQGEDISFHADVRGGDYDLVEWYVVGDDIEIGRGDDITRNFQRLGFEYVEARVYNWGNFLAADTVRVTITPMDAPDSLSVDVTGGPQGLVEPVTATLEAHPSGGDGNYQYVWYWPTADHVFSTERFPIIGDLMAGSHTFICEVTDGIGNTADDEIVITVLAQPDDNTLIWSVCPNLQVGPSDHYASTTATVEASGEYRNGYLQIEWDAVPSGTSSEVLVEVLRSDEHRYTWHLIKPASWGRKTVYYEVGSLNLQEGEISLNMYWLGDDKSSKSAEKCDGWDKWQLIWANTTLPASKSTDVVVIRLDDPHRDAYIQRQ